MAPASHRRTLRLAHPHRARRIDPLGDGRHPIGAGVRRSAFVADSLIVGGLLIAFSMWWMYFDRPVHDLLTNLKTALVWGYGHYLVFGAAAAVGAGLAVNVDYATHHAEISAGAAGAAVAIPVAIFILCLWFLHDRPGYRQSRWFGPVAALAILITPLSGHAVPSLASSSLLSSPSSSSCGEAPDHRPWRASHWAACACRPRATATTPGLSP